MKDQKIELPPLPEWADRTLQGDWRDEIISWAEHAIEADRKRRGGPGPWKEIALDAIRRMRAGHVGCMDIVTQAETLLQAERAGPQPANPTIKESLTTAEPVKVPSDAQLKELWRQLTEAGGDEVDFARALLARHGAQPAAADRSADNDTIGKPLRDDPANACRAHAAIAEVLRAQPAASAEPVGWQFYEDGEWHDGSRKIKDHRKNTEAAGIPTRDVFAAPVAAQPHLYDGDTLTAAYM